MKLNNIEFSEEESKVIGKVLPMTKAHLAKIVAKANGQMTSAKIYVPKEWHGDRVIVLNLGKFREGGKQNDKTGKGSGRKDR